MQAFSGEGKVGWFGRGGLDVKCEAAFWEISFKSVRVHRFRV